MWIARYFASVVRRAKTTKTGSVHSKSQGSTNEVPTQIASTKRSQMNREALIHEPINMPIQECKVIDFYARANTDYVEEIFRRWGVLKE